MKRLKVWSHTTTVVLKVPGHHNLAMVLVKASSQKRAVEILNTSKLIAGYETLGGFRGYWTETGNTRSLEVAATIEGEGLWYLPDETRLPTVADFVRVEVP